MNYVNQFRKRSINEFLLLEHFYEPLHGKIYKSINLIISKEISATVISLKNMLSNELAQDGDIEKVQQLINTYSKYKDSTTALSIVF
ncbi:replicative DNA helicase [Orientia tsutsugamushi str. Gilliam]|uniref:Replicative DNA helicase n=1 Tax=Orientia tsutsugamushi str. Gilliam TaxID=1359184 RepID=A0A2U3QX17_ORITS|nr:replicative DNA helicase [Orientia tsutsugamushi str. Gilliam]